MNATHTAPSIDTSALARYVEVVFGYLEGVVPIRMLAETGTAQQPPKLEFHPVDKVVGALTRLVPVAAREGRGLYVVPGTVAAAGSARAEDVIETGVLVIDIDAGEIPGKRAHLARHLGPPSLVVASGGITAEGREKLHLYWRLTEAARGEDLERVRGLRETIARKAGGDHAFASLHQPIRVAGSVHGKNGTRRSVRILVDEGHQYDLAELAAAAEAMPAVAGAGYVIDTGTGPLKGPAADLATRVIRAGGVDEVTRFEAISRVIGHWLRNARRGQCDLDAAWTAVVEYNAAMITPPWENERLRRDFDALLRRDVESHGPMPAKPDVAADPTGRRVVPPALSDDALAAAFVDAQGTHWRHAAVWGAWFHWTGTRWRKDETGLIREVVRLLCRAAAEAADKPGEARRIASDKTISAVVRVASADPRIATRASDWDAHPMLLNTPAGVVDLDTGEAGGHAPQLLLTQITNASPGMDCPRWKTFLAEIAGGDIALQAYLARLAGYCLTGSTTEQVFAFFLGSGANGKSVFLQTIAGVMGDHAATATLDTFMEAKASRHLTELAGLRAARLVLVPETEAGRSWAEGRIKMVTGGEKIRANFMHRDHFEYVPRFKLVVMGNHRPALTSVGEAMRRRMHLVPFTVTIPEERRDRTLAAMLMTERDGILGWMLAGCAEWRRMGLAPPHSIRAAAEDYFAAEDIVGQWIEEVCCSGPDQRATARALFASWSAWANAGGHPAGTQRALGEALRSRGLTSGKVGGARGWMGIAPRVGPSRLEAAE